ncbi:hypothetical protein KAZ82_00920, partial [Candidatus Babeliales bacterium]|nr:hypothetical protein [Candidatus Babeliales bacterium]
MKLSACFFILFSVLISYQSIFPGANAAHSYRGRNVFNMTAQLYGSGTSNLPDPVTVPHGGTGDTSLTQYGVLVGAGTNSVQVTAAGATGTV